MTGLLVAVALILAANVVGWIATDVFKRPAERDDYYVRMAYAMVIGALCAVIW